jgi:signal peptidase I
VAADPPRSSPGTPLQETGAPGASGTVSRPGPGSDGTWASGPDLGEARVASPSVATEVGPESGPPGDAQVPASGADRRNWRRFALEWIAVLLVAVGVAVAVRTFVVQTFYIPSASMEPTLMVGDRILVDKLSYHLHAVGRGDIVVFSKPAGEVTPGVNDLVKRVIGLPGETISSPDGRVWINGSPLAEPWLPSGTVTRGIKPQKIPQGEYFVMGDNRGDSSDSRVFGPIPKSLIVGRVVFRIWPLSHLGFF